MKIRQFDIVEVIGSGSFGKIYKGINKKIMIMLLLKLILPVLMFSNTKFLSLIIYTMNAFLTYLVYIGMGYTVIFPHLL